MNSEQYAPLSNTIKGETVTQERVLNVMVVSSVHGVGFGSSGDRNFSHELLYSEEPEPPSRMDESKFQVLMIKISTVWF